MQKVYIALVMLVLTLTTMHSNAKEITLWNYYTTPPFIIQDNSGLVLDTVNFLNHALHGQFKLKLKSQPRARIDRDLKKANKALYCL
ncbi:MAG: hypothetical protein ACI9ES_001783 [Oceanospirillaceae bacterium]|jgi:hypothetical protein